MSRYIYGIFFLLGLGWAITELSFAFCAYVINLEKKGKDPIILSRLGVLVACCIPFLGITIPAYAAHAFFTGRSFKDGHDDGWNEAKQVYYSVGYGQAKMDFKKEKARFWEDRHTYESDVLGITSDDDWRDPEWEPIMLEIAQSARRSSHETKQN